MVSTLMKLQKDGLLIGALFFLIGLAGCNTKQEQRMTSADGLSAFTEDIKAYYFQTLDSAAYYISQMDSSLELSENQQLFLESRKWYKMAEPMIIAYDHENYMTLNGPNLLKIEAEDFTDIKKLAPTSYQVLEETIFGDEPPSNPIVQQNIVFLSARLPFIKQNNMIYNQRDQHHVKMMRDLIVTVATKGITGFDSPALANSQKEAIYSYESLRNLVKIYKEAFSDDGLYENWMSEIASTIDALSKGNFETFDRYRFIKDHTNPQLEMINQMVIDFGIKLNPSRPLYPEADNLFAADFFNISNFSPPGTPGLSDELISLGNVLFNDASLSNTGNMSCASCHVKGKAFTDGLRKSVGTNGEMLERNAPTLTYASYQYKFFHDGRASTLESQIMGVLMNENEFHVTLGDFTDKVKTHEQYSVAFDTLYSNGVNARNIRNAISAYIRDQSPFNSKFDRNMRGEESTLTAEEISGFNLFMGKGACATCHFPPAFNGTVPPKYLETELENLGVPANASFTNPILDPDPGAFYPYEVEERRHFFKTPTVRNVELTAPYMHNGVYDSLIQVMKFYNFGGGAGMGLDVPYQTLPPDSLMLSCDELEAMIAFMKTLTDKEFSSL